MHIHVYSRIEFPKKLTEKNNQPMLAKTVWTTDGQSPA